MTALFTIAVQTQRTEEGAREYRLGGFNAVVYPGDLVYSVDGGASLDRELGLLADGGFPASCYRYGANLSLPGSEFKSIGFLESTAACPPSRWGYRLVDGRWPAKPGEVVATTATGVPAGTLPDGLAPEPLTVVGHVRTPHATRERALLAAPGTWRSWGWPEAQSRFPRLTSAVSLFIDTDEPAQLEDHFAARAQDDPAAGTVQILDSQHVLDGRTLVDRYPFLYAASGPLVLFLAMLVTVAFRRRVLTRQLTQLIQLGMSRGGSWLAVMLAFVAVTAAAALAGVAVGWLLGALPGRPMARWVSGHEAAPVPPPWDPLARLGVAYLLGLVFAAGGVLLTLTAGDRAVGRQARDAKLGRVEDLAGIAAASAAAWALLGIHDLGGVYLAILLTTVAIACWSRRIVQTTARLLPTSAPASRLARRRLGHRAGAAAAMFAVGALTTGPVLATMIFVATSLESANANERVPPAEGQAIYNASGTSSDEPIINTVRALAGSDGAVVHLYTPTTRDGDGVVASEQHLGAVALIDTVDQIGQVLGADVSDDSATVLHAGGIAFLRPGDQPASVWTIGDGPGREVRLPAATHIEADSRWARELAAVMLTSSGKKLGWTLGAPEVVITGLDDAEAQRVAAALAGQGFDPAIVATFDPVDPFRATPLMLGMMGAVALIGIVALIGASRASLRSLARDSQGLYALGAPRSWQSRVFGIETATAYLPGFLCGTLIATTIGLAGFAAMGLDATMPVVQPLAYLGATLLMALATVASGMLRLTASSASGG